MKPEQEPKEKEADIVKEEAPAPIKYGISGLSDVILVVEGQEFHVHKMALACRSTYFNALFYGNFQEMNKDRIEIKDVAAIPFKRLMDFMYNGKVSDAFPTFKSFRYIANTGFGDLKIKHAHVENRKEYIKNFWKASSEVLEVADRFDVKKSFQTYFEDMLSYNACTTASCFVCVTFYMFSLANALHILDLQFTMHDNNFVKEWLQLAVEANIPRSDAFNSLATYVNAVK